MLDKKELKMAINAFFAVMGLVFAFVSIKMGHDISASILLTGCIVSMALLEVAKAISGE